MEDCKISLQSSRKNIFLSNFELKFPNLFTLPEYEDDYLEMSSPCFELANVRWCFQFRASDELVNGLKGFDVHLVRLNSESIEQHVFYKITLLGTNDKYEEFNFNYVLYFEKHERENIMRHFHNRDPYDRRDTLTLIISLLPYQSTRVDIGQVPRIQVLPDKMAEKKKCKVYLKSSMKEISSEVYTLKMPNFFTLSEHGKSFELNSPCFEFDNATLCFQFCSDRIYEVEAFRLSFKRINTEKSKQKILYTATLFHHNDETYDCDMDCCFFDEYDPIYFLHKFDNVKPSYDRRDTLTMTVNLIQLESIKMDAAPLQTDRDSNLLCQDYKNLFMNGMNSDLTLKVGKKEFRVHQVILQARCQVFQAMLSHDMMEKNRGVIDVPDCDPQAMEQFLFYIYSGKVESLNQDNVLGVYYAADKYNMTFLKEECSEFMKKSFSSSIIAAVIQLALNHSDTDLLECATEYFVNHTSKIFPTVEWMSFVESNPIAANELLIKASKKWDSAK